MKKNYLWLITIILSGCTTYYVAPLEWDIDLKSAYPEGHGKMFAIDTLKNPMFYYQSEDVDVSIELDQFIMIKLDNKTDQTISVNWDAAIYVDYDARSHKLLRSDTRFQNTGSPQAHTYVASGTSFVQAFTIAPKVLQYRYDPILPNTAGQTYIDQATATRIELAAATAANDYVGKTVRLIIPIKKVDQELVLDFHFKINGYNIGSRTFVHHR